MRVFIAVELSSSIKRYIVENQRMLKFNSLQGKFTRKENFHLTLKFIGNVDNKQMADIKKAINITSKEFPSFEIELGDLGYFQRGSKKIVWIGIEKGRDKLKELAEILEVNLHERGFRREERKYKPHITIGREIVLKDKSFDELVNKLHNYADDIKVDKLTLMESKREEGILKYIPIYREKLR